MNFLQTYRRHLIFKLAGIAAVILAVLSSAIFLCQQTMQDLCVKTRSP